MRGTGLRIAVLLGVLAGVLAGCPGGSGGMDPGTADVADMPADSSQDPGPVDAADVPDVSADAPVDAPPDEAFLSCPPATPYRSSDGTECWACVNDSHCNEAIGEHCRPFDHVCLVYCPGAGCDGGGHVCADCVCHQCCVDADCVEYAGGDGTCTDYRCDRDECNGQCVAPFPVCKVINNVAQCVQCGSDDDCTLGDPTCTCSGDPTWTCLASDGNLCAGCGDCGAICTTDADCPPGPTGEALLCGGPTGGFCYDGKGSCDGTSTCCRCGAACFDFVPMLSERLAGTPAWPPNGLPWSLARCSCDDTHPCIGGVACTRAQDWCAAPYIGDAICPGGVPDPTLPERLCGDAVTMVNDLYPAR